MQYKYIRAVEEDLWLSPALPYLMVYCSNHILFYLYCKTITKSFFTLTIIFVVIVW